MDPMEGLRPGRIVYFVFSQQAAEEVMRRRTSGPKIAERLMLRTWPEGAQAHVGNPVQAGDIAPAMVVAVFTETPNMHGGINLKVMLDGSDVYWACSVPFDEKKRPFTWHWMFEGQAERYKPDRVEKLGEDAEGYLVDKTKRS